MNLHRGARLAAGFVLFGLGYLNRVEDPALASLTFCLASLNLIQAQEDS